MSVDPIFYERANMFCQHCGKGISEGASFCPSCGKAVSVGAQTNKEIVQAREPLVAEVGHPNSSEVVRPKEVYKEGKVDRVFRIGFSIIGVLAALLFAGGLFAPDEVLESLRADYLRECKVTNMAIPSGSGAFASKYCTCAYESIRSRISRIDTGVTIATLGRVNMVGDKMSVTEVERQACSSAARSAAAQ